MEHYNPDMPLENLGNAENYIYICLTTLVKIIFLPLVKIISLPFILIGFLIHKLNKKFVVLGAKE